MIFRLLEDAIRIIRDHRARDRTMEQRVQADFEEAVREFRQSDPQTKRLGR